MIILRLVDSLLSRGLARVERGVHYTKRMKPALLRGQGRLAQARFSVTADKHDVSHVEVRKEEANV